MALNEQERQIAEFGSKNNKSAQEIQDAISSYRATQLPQEKGMLSKVGGFIAPTATKTIEKIGKGEDLTGRDVIGSALEVGSLVIPAGAVARGVGLAIKGAGLAKKGLSARALETGAVGAISGGMAGAGRETGAGGTPEEIAKATISGAVAGGAIGGALPVLGRGVGLTASTIKSGSGNVKQKLVEFVSPDADDATKNILKKSTEADVDRIVAIQEKASLNGEAITPYEAIGDTMAKATKQLESQRKALSQQKSAIIGKAKFGLGDFSTPTRNIILDIRRALKNDTVADTFVAKLKTVKNKLQADKAIDELQDILYSGNKDLTIPVGSAADKQLKGLLGKYNTSLKNSLPTSYKNLNTQISDRTKVITSLNKALGEVVEGVSTRGGSLVKQFFSPNARKAKELFAYIEKNTGIDIAKDATLSRYVMELFNDPRAKTLLGGDIPTSVSGVTNKIVDFAVTKTGVGRALQEAQRKGAIQKARRLTRPK